jgi:hypothetical protein
MWKYLDLMDSTAAMVEDLYLRMLKCLDFERTNRLTVFK